jgi:hypothetical protein
MTIKYQHLEWRDSTARNDKTHLRSHSDAYVIIARGDGNCFAEQTANLTISAVDWSSMSFRAKDAANDETHFRGPTQRIRASIGYERNLGVPRPKRFDRSKSLRGTSWDYSRPNELRASSDHVTERFAQSSRKTFIATTVYHVTCHVTQSAMDEDPYGFPAPEPDSDDSHRSYGAHGITSKRDWHTPTQSYCSSFVMVDEPDSDAHTPEWETYHGDTTGIYLDFPSRNHQERIFDRQASYDSFCEEFNKLYANTYRGATSKSFSPLPFLMSSDGCTAETNGDADCCGDPILGQIRLLDDEDTAYGDQKPAATGAPTKKDSQLAPVIEIAPGHFAELRGSAETCRAMQRGFTRSCTCLCCNAQLGCIHNACYVLCPDCLVVNPVEGSIDNSGGVGLGFIAGGMAATIG